MTRALQRFLRGETDSGGDLWLPLVGWTTRDGYGAPWALRFSAFPATGEWDFLAWLGHCVIGLHDVHEHSFDAWDRPWKDWCEELLVPGGRVVQVGERLGLSPADADQFLAYRTLHTRAPVELLAFLNRDYCGFENPPAVSLLEIEADIDGQVSGTFALPVAVERPFRIDGDLNLSFVAAHHPAANERASAFLDLALTFHEIPRQELFVDSGPTRLTFRPEGIPALRAAITDYDVSKRIGTIDSGAYSDRALRRFLAVRVKNLAAPAPLWRAILDGDESGLNGTAWRLPLPPIDENEVFEE